MKKKVFYQDPRPMEPGEREEVLERHFAAVKDYSKAHEDEKNRRKEAKLDLDCKEQIARELGHDLDNGVCRKPYVANEEIDYERGVAYYVHSTTGVLVEGSERKLTDEELQAAGYSPRSKGTQPDLFSPAPGQGVKVKKGNVN